MKTRFVNGSRTSQSVTSTSKARSIPWISSPKRCATALIFDAYEIPSCVDLRISFSSHIWTFISLVSRMSPRFIRSCLPPPLLRLVPCTGLISLLFVSCHYVTHSRLFHISQVLVAKSCGAPFESFLLRLCEMLSLDSVVPLDSGSSFLFLPWMLFLHIEFTQVEFSLPCSFSWMRGWGVLVCPWSASVA